MTVLLPCTEGVIESSHRNQNDHDRNNHSNEYHHHSDDGPFVDLTRLLSMDAPIEYAALEKFFYLDDEISQYSDYSDDSSIAYAEEEDEDDDEDDYSWLLGQSEHDYGFGENDSINLPRCRRLMPRFSRGEIENKQSKPCSVSGRNTQTEDNKPAFTCEIITQPKRAIDNANSTVQSYDDDLTVWAASETIEPLKG